MVIVGPTGSGKSSLLAALLTSAKDERIVILESLPELPRLSSLWVRLAARGANLEGMGAFSLAQLLVEALRLRPDRLVIGEVRGPEAGVLADALATGHAGVAATLHAGCDSSALARLRRWDEQFQGMHGQPVIVSMARPFSVQAVRKI
jgi:pilus assembly protein CpaF